MWVHIFLFDQKHPFIQDGQVACMHVVPTLSQACLVGSLILDTKILNKGISKYSNFLCVMMEEHTWDNVSPSLTSNLLKAEPPLNSFEP